METTHIVEELILNLLSKYKSDMNCEVCKVNECTQRHLLECPILIGKNEQVTYLPNYSDLFESNISEQVYIATLMKDNLERKKLFLDKSLLDQVHL